MSRRRQGGGGCIEFPVWVGVMVILLILGLGALANGVEARELLIFVTTLVVVVLLWAFPVVGARRRERAKEAQERQRVESLLRRDAVGDEINYMSGPEFERFMADVFRQKGYDVQETKSTGDQGVDLLLDIDERKVAVQLKRWTGPVGNKAVQATFAGMAHYQADEGWIITTSTFTKSARELARSTRVRLIDGKELGDWLEGLSEEE